MKTIVNKIFKKPLNMSHMFRVTISLTQTIYRRGWGLDDIGPGDGFFDRVETLLSSTALITL